MRRESTIGLRTVAGASLWLLALPAQAYLDPGTGSLILSAIVGLLATIGLTFKTWWYRLRALFRRNAPAATPGGGETRQDTAPAGQDGPAGR